MRQPDLFLSLKRDLALASFLIDLSFVALGRLPYLAIYSFVVSMQCIQEVFIAEEWVNKARKKAKAEADLLTQADEALGAFKLKV